MKPRTSHRHASLKAQGFTLIEIAIAIFVITLLLGAILVPLQRQIEQRKISATQKSLEEIKEALIGFAMINGRLPCPDTDTDPSAAGYGIEESSCTTPATAVGYLPWKTLGVAPQDAFGIPSTTAPSQRIGDWRYRVDSNFAQAFTLTTHFGDCLQVEDNYTPPRALTGTASSQASCNASGSEFAVAIVYSTGPNTVADGQNASPGTAVPIIYQSDVPSPSFDDILVWITRPILMNRMVSAGKFQ